MKPIFKSVLKMPSFKKDGGDLSVAEIVAVVEEQEESRISGISGSNILLSSKTSNTQFHATKRWNKLITKFYETMPKRKHRGFIFSYENIFTGKEAVQFLVTTLFPQICLNKPVDETNGIKFMELLLKKKLIENVKFPECQLFISKAIYRFLTVNIAAEIEATNLKRSNSITNFAAASHFASSFRPKAGGAALDRRISSSCSNLQNLIKAESKIETKNPLKFSSILKTTKENADEQERFGKNKMENDYFLKQITCDRYSNPSINNEFLSTPTTTSSSDCTADPSSAFSISTVSSAAKSAKRFAAFESSNNPPVKRFNQSPISNYDRINECETASKSEEYLLLLDSLIADEMLTERQKQRKLKGFRETYPQIYLIRFPEAAFTPKPRPRQPTPIRVFQKLIRRNSANRK
uniref:DEP domain-containing protein n=1 Tax=Panagrolaimus superbus TaxID=310955 RepID=A0A914YT72_9BILA